MPDESALPGRTGLPTPTPIPTPTPNTWPRKWAKPLIFVVVGLVALSVLFRFFWPNGNRPECDHDDHEQTIAGRYTKVPEYQDCQFLVIKKDGALVYGKMTALFLSEKVIDGAVQAATFTAPLIVPGVAPVALPGGLQLGANSLAVIAAAQFAGGGRFPRVLPAAVTTGTATLTPLGDASGGVVLPWVQVVADEEYKPLGIRKGFNCMYFVAFTNAAGVPLLLTAKMVATDKSTYQDCNDVNYMTNPGFPLKVSPNGSGEVPTAARWDWSTSDQNHVIGVPCPTPKTVGSSPAPDSTAPTGGSSPRTPTGIPAVSSVWVPGDWCDVGAESSKGEAPVHMAKGWYDEQYLADPAPGGPVRTDVIGTVFPVPGLDKRDAAFYSTGFQIVARVALRLTSSGALATASLAAYTTRFGFQAVAPSAGFVEMNSVALCYGTDVACGVPSPLPTCKSSSSGPEPDHPTGPWWARTQAADGTNPKYFCVVYRGHPDGFKMPGMVRWRFHPNPGETNWIACPEGCCELGG